MKAFPRPIRDFRDAFLAAQSKRHAADYDPAYRITKSEAHSDASTAERAIRNFMAVPVKDRRALAAWVALPNRK